MAPSPASTVSRQVRTAAMFNGDLTPLKNADVTFSELETPDGRHFNIDTDATERTTKVVRMADPDQRPPFPGTAHRRGLPLDQAGTAASAFSSPHKMDKAKQALYAQFPCIPRNSGREPSLTQS
jgi:hypothetical protein